MNFIDEDFKFFTLPPRHDLLNYRRYNRYEKIDYGKYDYYIYLISNPYPLNQEKTTSEYAVKVAILVKNKETGNLTLDYEEFNFKTLLELNIFSKIYDNGSIRPFEDTNDKFSNLILEEEITIENTLNYELLTLEEVVNKFDILKRCDIHLKTHFKDIMFYSYTINGKIVLIPSIEILKYFYLYNMKDLKSHFAKDILHKHGINNALNKSTFDFSTSTYKFEINGNYSIDDRYKILFFLVSKKRLELYSRIADEYIKNKTIKAQIPRKKVTFRSRVGNYKKKNILLVLNITFHDVVNDFPDKLKFEYSHTKSFFENEKTGKRNPKEDKNKKRCDNQDLDINDSEYADSSYEYNDDTQESLYNNIEREEVYVKLNIDGTKIVNDQKEEKGGRLRKVEVDKSLPSTSLDSLGNEGKAVSQKELTKEEREKVNLTINEIRELIQTDSIFIYLNEKRFPYPIVEDDHGKILNKSIMFIDDKKQIRRYYTIIEASYNRSKFYLIELQPQLNNKKKATLIIFKESTTIDEINENYIKKQLYSFVLDRDRRWSFNSFDLSEKYYTTVKHTNTTSTLKTKITEHHYIYLR